MSPSLLLLPHGAVLVPGGALTLRLVRPAHLELVRECSRRDAGPSRSGSMPRSRSSVA